jgi:hypothetical protein
MERQKEIQPPREEDREAWGPNDSHLNLSCADPQNNSNLSSPNKGNSVQNSGSGLRVQSQGLFAHSAVSKLVIFYSVSDIPQS